GTLALRPFLSLGEAFVISCRACCAAMYPRVMPSARTGIPKYRFMVSFLPEEFHCQLNFAARACARNAAEVGCGRRGARRPECHLIERVERLDAKLEPQTFANRDVLHQREIGAIRRRAADDVSPGIAIDATGQQGGIHEGRRVEILEYLLAAIIG